MTETHVSATDLRVYFKDHANRIAREGGAVVVYRHGLELAVLVSLEDYKLLKRLKGKERKAEPLDHPDVMTEAEVERVLAATEQATDEATLDWRAKARLSLSARRWFRSNKPPPS